MMPRADARREGRRRLAAALFGLGVSLALLAGAEFWARRAGFAPPPPRSPQAQQAYLEMLRGLLQPSFARVPAAKGPRTRRIAVIGESSAGLLAQRAGRLFFGAGGEDFEVLDLSRGGTSLAYVRPRLEEALKLEPDAVVLLFGNNLLYRHPPNLLAARLTYLGRRSALVHWATMRDSLGAGERARRLSELEGFLRETAPRLRRRRIPFIVCTVPGNLWVPPSDLPVWLAGPQGLRALVQRHAAGRRAGVRAIDEDIRNAVAAASYVGARWLAQEGDLLGAYERLVRARELDGQSERVLTATNALVRRLGGLGEFWVLDLEGLLLRQAPGGIPGWGQFQDHQHLNARMARLEAAALGELLRSRLWPALRLAGPAWEPEPSGLEAYLWFLHQRFAPPDGNFVHALEDLFAHHIAGGRAGADAVERAARSFRLALPGLSEPEARALLLFHAGSAFSGLGRRAKARELLEASWRARPSQPAALRRALLALEGRDLASARRWLKQAPEAGGQAAAVLAWLDDEDSDLGPRPEAP